MNLDDVRINRVLFMDIETATNTRKFSDLSELMQYHFKLKFHRYYEPRNETPELWYEREAGLHSEFCRICCITLGRIVSGEKPKLELVSCASEKEEEVLDFLLSYLAKMPEDVSVAAYNGIEFDAPTVARRLIINGKPLPPVLNLQAQKPWERRILDPMDWWKFGDKRHFCKLELMAELLGIPTSKDELDGSQVSKVFWEDKDLDKIKRYCQKDVVVLANILMKLKGLPTIPQEQVVIK